MGMLGKFKYTIKIKLVLMVAIPLLGLLGFAGNELLQQNQFSSEIGKIQDFSKFATAASNLVHELQKERGATAGYIGSKGMKFSDILPNQHQTTDIKLEAFYDFMADFDETDSSAEFQKFLEHGMNELKRIQQVRSKAKSLDIPLKDALTYYTNINGQMLSTINSIVKITPEAQMTRSLTTYVNFLQSKERAGIIRAVLSNVFAAGGFSGNLFERYSKLNTEHETYLKVFLSLAHAEQVEFFEQKMRNDSVTEVAKMQAVATTAGIKASKFSPLIFKLGYGHVIHNFKNNILRRSAKYSDQAAVDISDTLKIINTLNRDASISIEDRNHLATVKAMLLDYQEANKKAAQMAKRGASSKEIDRSIRINDGPAMLALTQLAEPKMGIDSTYWFKQMTGKINLLKEVEDKLSEDLNKEAIELQSAIMQVYILTGLAILITLIFGITQTRTITNLLIKLVHNLTNSSSEVAQASSEISSSSVSMASGATEQAASIEETSASLHELSSQSDSNASAAHMVADKIGDIEKSVLNSLQLTEEASGIAVQAGDAADNGVKAMENILDSMKSIKAGSEKINDIIEVINEITHQTKMLATNAAIEAARAGEQGKGFAVVADEVALLAENSKASAKMISKLIRDNTDNAQQGNDLAKNGGVVLHEIFDNNQRLSKIMHDVKDLSQDQASSIQEISQQVESISTASKEQSQGVGQINQAIAQMELVIQTNAASAEETASASEELSAQAAMLQSLVVDLSKEMGAQVTLNSPTPKQREEEAPQLLTHSQFEQF